MPRTRTNTNKAQTAPFKFLSSEKFRSRATKNCPPATSRMNPTMPKAPTIRQPHKAPPKLPQKPPKQAKRAAVAAQRLRLCRQKDSRQRAPAARRRERRNARPFRQECQRLRAFHRACPRARPKLPTNIRERIARQPSARVSPREIASPIRFQKLPCCLRSASPTDAAAIRQSPQGSPILNPCCAACSAANSIAWKNPMTPQLGQASS